MEKELILRFLSRYRRAVLIVLAASTVFNLLVFAGSLYMLLVYDSVLPSRSVPTLFGLFGILIVIYLMQAAFEAIRSDALLALANGIYRDLNESVHRTAAARSLTTQRESEGMRLTRDLDQVHTYLSSSGPVALVDLPWVPLFLLVLAALHWSLGLAALAGSLVLAALAWLTSWHSAKGTRSMVRVAADRGAAAHAEFRLVETAVAMGMQERLLKRARAMDEQFIAAQSYLSRTIARLGGASRTFRLFLQSAILTVGAVLVIDGKASGGVILAASILTGRALAPVDQALANARNLAAARSGWGRIVAAIAESDIRAEPHVALPAPANELAVRDLWVAPPGTRMPAVQGLSFSLSRGEGLAIVGPSGAGKSTLVKALLGVWKPIRGEVRLDGATYDQWDRDRLGRSIGYVPQAIELFEGTIGENIARFDPAATSEAIIAAASVASLHNRIVAMPEGYETRLGPGSNGLSAGERQRIALACALYGDPFLLVLDEPSSNLDTAGEIALARAIEQARERGGIVVMVTHRPTALGNISHVAVLADGRMVDFGPRDAVLARQGDARIGPQRVVSTKTPLKKVGS